MQIFFATGTTEKAHNIDPVATKGLPEILNANYLMLHQAVNFRIASAKEITISVLQEGKTIKGVLFRVFSC